MVRKKGREITGVYPQSLQDPKMGGSRLAKMADEEEELGTSGHEVEQVSGRVALLRNTPRLSQGGMTARGSGYRGAFAQSPISARRRRKFFLRSESCGNFD